MGEFQKWFSNSFVYFFRYYIFLIISLVLSCSLKGQGLAFNNYIFIDVNSLVSPKNYNEILTNDQLLSTQKRCKQKIQDLIKSRRGENFTVIYIHDLTEGSIYYRREFNSSDPQYLNDSLLDFRQISTGSFTEYNLCVVRLLEQLITWGIEFNTSQRFTLTFVRGGDIHESKNFQSQYLNRFIQFTGLIEEQSLKLNKLCQIRVFCNCININKNENSENNQFDEICY